MLTSFLISESSTTSDHVLKSVSHQNVTLNRFYNSDLREPLKCDRYNVMSELKDFENLK